MLIERAAAVCVNRAQCCQLLSNYRQIFLGIPAFLKNAKMSYKMLRGQIEGQTW